jgi:hypothetical protein
MAMKDDTAWQGRIIQYGKAGSYSMARKDDTLWQGRMIQYGKEG